MSRIVLGFLPFAFLTLVVANCTGTRPTNLGVRDGKLAPCPSSPNCVSSQVVNSDETHFIFPYEYKSKTEDAQKKLVAAIQSLPRTLVVIEKPDYVYAEFTSFTMRFVDDVEFYFAPDQKTIHIRSASRLGHSDLGVNRKRMEKIRGLLSAP
ncbi:DUF1499 domain-containing protein [Leptospira fletcheri]|uniref:DUF1499 domain-containing protein n=1 Tax=Leptospira fletcheri TaxID=2484981 RepID=A0A4R9GJ84_9LEPT|nr:DUF1499 domain-containing protein [Leptospira fletcheri]TGK12481.1 DUF1499 domain-containing protein [Leptospira fletcheri]